LKNIPDYKLTSASVTNILREIKKKDVVAPINGTAQEKDVIVGTSPQVQEEEKEIDFSDTPYPDNYPNPNIEPAVNVKSVVKAQEDAEKTEGRETGQHRTLSTTADSEPIIDIRMDWNDPELYQRRLFRAIIEDRRERREEFQRAISQRSQELNIRESRLADYESLIPSARELRNHGVTIEMLLPYLSLIQDKAAVENVDIKTAAINLARDLEDYKQAMSDLKAEGLRIRDLTKLAERKMDDDYANNLIWGDNW
jgi:hypothetical protein